MMNRVLNQPTNNGITVYVKDGENYEDLMKRFKKKHSKSGISKEFKEKMYHEKPSIKKRRKKMQAQVLRHLEEEKISRIRDKYKKQNSKYKREDKDDDKSHRWYYDCRSAI